jgi:hypothetical protein
VERQKGLAMRQVTLSGLVKRRFVHCVSARGYTVRRLVETIGVAPGDLCRVIAGQNTDRLFLSTYLQIARWLRMPLANVIALSGTTLKLGALVQLGMEVRGYCSTRSADQIAAAGEVGMGVAVFRRALHGYADFRPSLRTCDRLADWLAWSGFDADDIALAAGMVVLYRRDGQRVTMTSDASRKIEPYPCACGRAGCMVPAHITSGPRRKWRSDACRMWAKRQAAREARSILVTPRASLTALPHPAPLVRFIMINERPVPVRF